MNRDPNEDEPSAHAHWALFSLGVAGGLIRLNGLTELLGVVEIVAPPAFIGKPLAESGFRKEYNLTVVAIRRMNRVLILPTANEQIIEGDILVILGRPEDCDRITEKKK